eukprot:GHVS01067238.1.p1 GENE.GHVS01067238.1~~GHVS01067238.1.p1  ORF type:complete len:457 (+),score=74.16 GHVS01067238.1:156-1526(+)
MNLSRRACLGLLVVGVGTATAAIREYKLGAGGIDLLEGGETCPEVAKPLHYVELEAVRDLAGKKAAATGDEKPDVGTEDKPVLIKKDEWWYAEDDQTGMFYDENRRTVSIATRVEPKRENFIDFIKHTKAVYKVDSKDTFPLLKLLTGVTVCMDEKSVIDEFRKEYKQDDWEKLINSFFTEVATRPIIERLDDRYVTVEIAGEETTAIEDIHVKDGLFKVGVSVAKGLGAKKVLLAIGRVLQGNKSVEEKKNVLMLFGKGCAKLALMAKSGPITYELVEDEDMRPLGNIAELVRKEDEKKLKEAEKAEKENKVAMEKLINSVSNETKTILNVRYPVAPYVEVKVDESNSEDSYDALTKLTKFTVEELQSKALVLIAPVLAGDGAEWAKRIGWCFGYTLYKNGAVKKEKQKRIVFGKGCANLAAHMPDSPITDELAEEIEAMKAESAGGGADESGDE